MTLAHVARPFVLAQALNADRYEVHFASDARYRKLFADAPFSYHTLESISFEKFHHALANSKPVYDTDTLRKYVAGDRAVIEEVNPDVVVGDFRLSLAVSAPLSRVPYMAVSNAYWSPYARLRYPVPELPLTRTVGVRAAQLIFDVIRPTAFALHALPLNRLRQEYGLAPLGRDMRRIYTWGDHTLYADIPELIPTRDLPPNHHHLGPILWSPNIPLPDWWDELPRDRPVIYVTVGSSGRTDVLPLVMDALADLQVTVIASTAGRIQPQRVPDNAYIADYLPGDRCVSRARLVICNGGSPATQQALSGGVPLLGIPTNLDQHLNMDVIQRHGAGVTLRSEGLSGPRIRNAVVDLLDAERPRAAAQRLARLFSQYDAPRRFAALLDEVVG